MKQTILKIFLAALALSFAPAVMAKGKVVKKKFNLEKLTSKKSLKSLRGKPVVLELFASWCNACAPSMQKLSKWHRGKRKSRFIPLSVDETKGEAHSFFKRDGMGKYRKQAYFDKNSQLASQLKFRGLPATIILDKNHRVVKTYVGEVSGKKLKDIHNTLRRLKAAN